MPDGSLAASQLGRRYESPRRVWAEVGYRKHPARKVTADWGWGGRLVDRGGLSPQQKAPWSTHSHFLRFFLSLGLQGLGKFRGSKIKNKMRETGA